MSSELWSFIAVDDPPPRPAAVTHELTQDRVADYARYNTAIGHMVTPDVLALRTAIVEAQEFNENRGFGARRIVIVDAPSHVGKTTSLRALAAQQTRQAPRPPDPLAPAPHTWLYVEANPLGKGRAMVKSLLHAASPVPPAARDTAADIVEQLAAIAPHMGLRGIIIDDAHFLAANRSDSLLIANVLKHLINKVPATIVLAAVNAKALGLLQSSTDGNRPSDQLVRRATWVELRPLPLHVDGELNPQWIDLVKSLNGQFALPQGLGQFRLRSQRSLTYLVKQCDGWPGPAIDWIIAATNHAIRHDLPVDRAALEATRHMIDLP